MKINKIVHSKNAPKEVKGVLWVSPEGFKLFGNGSWYYVDAETFTDIYNKLGDLAAAITGLPTPPPVVIPTPESGTNPPDSSPSAVGLFYIDLSADSGGLYYSVGTDTVDDWRQA